MYTNLLYSPEMSTGIKWESQKRMHHIDFTEIDFMMALNHLLY